MDTIFPPQINMTTNRLTVLAEFELANSRGLLISQLKRNLTSQSWVRRAFNDLLAAGYIIEQSYSDACYRITNNGRDALKEWRNS